MRVNLLMH